MYFKFVERWSIDVFLSKIKSSMTVRSSNWRSGFLLAILSRGAGPGTRVFLKSVTSTTTIFLSADGEGYGTIYRARAESRKRKQEKQKSQEKELGRFGANWIYHHKGKADFAQ